MIPIEWIHDAASRIAGVALKTPVTYDNQLQVYLKWENRQVTRSFKLRGALNKVLALPEWERARGLVTASAGNHGQGVALAARKTGAQAIIFASEHTPPVKIKAIRELGAEVRLVEGGYAEAEIAGLRCASNEGKTWISGYNDGLVIAGQGTIGLELYEQIQPFTPQAVVVPVGGGGLISGIGAVLAAHDPRPRLIGVQSEASAFMHTLYHRRPQQEVVETDSIADGLAGWVEETSITIPLVRQYVDEFILVTEEEIEKAMVYAWEKYGEIIEGSAAVCLAAVLSSKISSSPTVLVFSGGNVQPDLHNRLCEKWAGIATRGTWA